MEVLSIIVAYVVAKYSIREKTEKNIAWKLPLVLFGVLMFFHIFLLAPYYYNVEKQSAIDGLKSNINELQKEISDLKAKVPTKLNITSSVGSNPTRANTGSVDVTITARGKPPYSNKITQTIQNPNPRFFMYEVVRFKTSEGFKFSPLDANLKLPEYFIVQAGYEDTDIMMVIIKDYPPLASTILPLEVYTFNKNMEGTEKITEEIIVMGVEKSIE
jgi:hypothetical protein